MIVICGCLNSRRLRQQLLSTWQSLLHAVKNESRNRLSEYLHSHSHQHVSEQVFALVILSSFAFVGSLLHYSFMFISFVNNKVCYR